MWNRQKLLLVAIIFTAVYHKVTAGKGELLDMAPDVIDDIYEGCREQAMEKFIRSGLLSQELNTSKAFMKAWTSNPQCHITIPGATKEHTAALSAYYNGDETFITTFSDAVQTMGVNVSIYENQFHFKSLHFLLMDSIKLQQPIKCKTVYVLQDKPKAPTSGSQVRFGSFTLANSDFEDLKSLEDLDGQVLLKINSCFFANLGEHICSNDKNAVLLSPAEVFTVDEVHTLVDNNDAKYKEVVLNRLQLNSTHNCYVLSRSPALVSIKWLVPMLVALSFLSLTV
ncbi:ecto-ADP-ribosyltransferase 3 [Pholidichthys leucotaenia]